MRQGLGYGGPAAPHLWAMGVMPDGVLLCAYHIGHPHCLLFCPGKGVKDVAKTYIPRFLHMAYDMKRYVDHHKGTMESNFIDSQDVTNLESMIPLLSWFANKWPAEREAP